MAAAAMGQVLLHQHLVQHSQVAEVDGANSLVISKDQRYEWTVADTDDPSH